VLASESVATFNSQRRFSLLGEAAQASLKNFTRRSAVRALRAVRALSPGWFVSTVHYYLQGVIFKLYLDRVLDTLPLEL